MWSGRAGVAEVPHVFAALASSGVAAGCLVLDNPGGEDLFVLGDADPEGLGGELVLAVAEFGLERPLVEVQCNRS